MTKCFRCKCELISHDEQDNGVCDDCADYLADEYQKTKEWEYYHND